MKRITAIILAAVFIAATAASCSLIDEDMTPYEYRQLDNNDVLEPFTVTGSDGNTISDKDYNVWIFVNTQLPGTYRKGFTTYKVTYPDGQLCRNQIKMLEEAIAITGNDNVRPVVIAMREPEDTETFYRQERITLPLWADRNISKQFEIFNKFAVCELWPIIYIINEDGTVRNRVRSDNLNTESLVDMIKNL